MMKKFTWLLSLASLMVPMTLSAQQVKKDVTSDVTLLKGSSSLLKKNVPAPADKQVQKLSGLTKGSSLRRGPKAEPSADAVVWDFESEDQFNEWTLVDKDGDGFNWEYYNNEGKETGRMTAHEGNGLVASASYDNETGTALTPDNWMISPEVSLGGVLSFWACGQDASYAAEVFGVYVCEGSSTDPADFVQVGEDITATGEMTMYDFDLSEYAGKTGRIAIRHYNVTDMFKLNIDDVCLEINTTEPYACYQNGTLTFYYDTERNSRTGTTYDLNTGKNATGWDTDGTKSYVTEVVFDPSFAEARPTTTYRWFYNMTNLQAIEGICYLNTSEVTNMFGMFSVCKKLTSLDLSGFNTAQVTDMGAMFWKCGSLKTIYVGNGWSTEAVTGSSKMFSDCNSLVGGQGTTYDASHIDATYAHIDGGTSNPGYFTAAAGIATNIEAVPDNETSVQGIYTLDGRELNELPTKKGIYIIDGRRVVIK